MTARRCHRCLPLLALALVAGAVETSIEDDVAKALSKRDEQVAAADQDRDRGLAKLGESRDQGLAKATATAIKELEKLAAKSTRAGDQATTARVWTTVLKLDQAHAQARDFFTAAGTLDAVLAAIAADNDIVNAKPPPTALPAGRRLDHARLAAAWTAPAGGTLATGEVISITGPGRGDTEWAVALLGGDVGDNFALQGEYQRAGPYAGFALACDAEKLSCVSVYSEDAGLAVYSHDTATARTRLQLLPLPVAAAGSPWEPFLVARKGAAMQLTFGKNTQVLTLPENRRGPRLGLITYHASAMRVRNLTLIIAAP